MRVIHKYSLALENFVKDGTYVLRVPSNATPLFINVQGYEIFVWMEVNPQAKVFEERRIILYATGEKFRERDDDCSYWGSVQMKDQEFDRFYVWHFYEHLPSRRILK